MKIKVEIDINITGGENPEAVLRGYFDSHMSARKIYGFKVLESSGGEIIDAEFEDVPAAEIAAEAKTRKSRKTNSSIPA